ncbi:hypothetical protein OA981_02940 [Prochlorococcus sp. AH-716-A09]|nr:hypothetical protein [Prochlorococcus sp. AH-716-A09]
MISLISVDTSRFNNIEALMIEMEKNASNYKYSVAWIDSLHKKFRGVLTRGNHLKLETLNFDEQKNHLEIKEEEIDIKFIVTS